MAGFTNIFQGYRFIWYSIWAYWEICFFFGVLFLMFCSLVIGFYIKNRPLIIYIILLLITFMLSKIFFYHIEDYYYKQAVLKANVIKADLKQYKEKYKELPETLQVLYEGKPIPEYNIGVLKYDFGYHKRDSNYSLSFNFFEGLTFINRGEYNTWIVYD